MQVEFELVVYDQDQDKFDIDENVYTLELNEEQEKTFNLLKGVDIDLYNWFKESDFFINWIKEDVYPNIEGKQFAINAINDIGYFRFYFFKITSSDAHYNYFKKFFNIHEESEWQDREVVGEEILNNLSYERKKLIFELTNNVEQIA